MTKHTPGPWTHYDDTTPAGKTGRHEIVAMGRTVARIYATKGLEADDLANARLIAAAPDLLAALERAVSWFDEYAAGHRIKGAVEKAERNQLRADSLRAAIARATGAA